MRYKFSRVSLHPRSEGVFSDAIACRVHRGTFGTMLIAATSTGTRIEASHETPRVNYSCPECQTDVIVRKGKKVVPHFAHRAKGKCQSAGESWRHLAAKRMLGDGFRAMGYNVAFEESHSQGRRRVDVAVTLTATSGEQFRIAVEVQDSPISVDEIKRRIGLDRQAGFFCTVWVFTQHRLRASLDAPQGAESRLPNEVVYLENRYKWGAFVIDTDEGALTHLMFEDVVRSGESYSWSYYEDGEEIFDGVDYPDHKLRLTKKVTRSVAGFQLAAVKGPGRGNRPPESTAILKVPA